MTQGTPTRPLTAEVRPALQLLLRVVSGPDFGKTLTLAAGTYVVGKAAQCDLVLTDSSVSRSHLLVQVLPAGARLVDNQSTNGCFQGASRFGTLEAGPGMEIRIGQTVLRLEPTGTAAAALPPSERTSFGALVGRSLRMRQVFALLERLAPSDVDVLVLGETGTGKELCARALHDGSPRHAGPFVVVDTSSLSHALVESELFGHERGAFTGALERRAGLFERADGGTLFLDEVGEMPLELQARLLRLLDTREVRRVGSDVSRKLDVRVVAATHRDLGNEVLAGRFRRDLFHRLAVGEVTLPPLRERAEDLPLLIESIASHKGYDARKLSAESRALLAGYAWPGNVRELKNLVERAVGLGLEPMAPAPETSSGTLPFKDAKERLLQVFERDYLERLLERCDHNLSRAAREAQVERLHLRKLLRKHGLRAP